MTTILHVTDAAFAGVLHAVTDLARVQSARPGTSVVLAYVPRPQSPDITHIRELAGDRVRVLRLTEDARRAAPGLALRLPGVLRETDPDIIHLHSTRAGLIGRLIALTTGRRARVVYSPHGFAFVRPQSSASMRSLYARIERLGTRMTPALALCSPSEQDLARRALPAARTAVLPNAVDVEQLRTLVHARGLGSPLSIVHVGRITEQKLAETFGSIARRWSGASTVPARFRWIGDGDRSALPAEVEVTGWLDRGELLREVADADIVLFTSAGEGMPMALLEAQAMGVPVVASRVTGVVDVVEDGRTGLLADGEEALLAALLELADSAPRREELGRAAARRMHEEFDMSLLAQRSMTAYQTLGIRIPQMEGAS